MNYEFTDITYKGKDYKAIIVNALTFAPESLGMDLINDLPDKEVKFIDDQIAFYSESLEKVLNDTSIPDNVRIYKALEALREDDPDYIEEILSEDLVDII